MSSYITSKLRAMNMEITELLHDVIERGASDLHIAVGKPPILRIHNSILSAEYPTLMPDDTQRLIYSILNDEQKLKFEMDKELDFSLSLHDFGRFRVNVHYQRGTVGAALRCIPMRIPSLNELHLPEVIETMVQKKSGLVLVTGPTGSGKSTTLAALIDMINTNRSCHIITVEDPIEYLHKHKMSLIEQREVGSDTHSFATALKYVLRQDPDVILIGEMRDLETISAALTAAETGHLVFATLHTADAAQTVDRIVDVFPSHQQTQIRLQLAQVVLGVFCQRLLPRIDGGGMVPAVEVMIATPAISSLIRENKTHQILSTIETSLQTGMQTMDRSLAMLMRKQLISRKEAETYARKPQDLERYT